MTEEQITKIAQRHSNTLDSVRIEAIVEMCENAIAEALMVEIAEKEKEILELNMRIKHAESSIDR